MPKTSSEVTTASKVALRELAAAIKRGDDAAAAALVLRNGNDETIAVVIGVIRQLWPEGTNAGADLAVAELLDQDGRNQTDHIRARSLAYDLIAQLRHTVENRTLR